MVTYNKKEDIEAQWLSVIPHPSCVTITGARGEGKSVLGFYLLELFYKRRGLPVYALGLPEEKFGLLPDFITGFTDIESIPENSVSFIDESSIRFHSYKWHTKETLVMDRIILSSRHRDQTLIFATHTLRKFAVGLVLDMNAIILKSPSKLHARMERRETKELTKIAKQHFNKIVLSERCKYAYVSSETYEGMLKNPTPSFWSEKLSKSYSGIKMDSGNSTSPIQCLLSEKPGYHAILMKIIDYQKAHQDTWLDWQGFSYSNVGVEPTTLRRLYTLGVIYPPYHFRSKHKQVYRIVDIKKLEAELNH